MKKKVSDNQLILIVIIAVVMSSFSILTSFVKLNLTGSYMEEGNVTVKVLETVELQLPISHVLFVASKPGWTRNSYEISDVINCNTAAHNPTDDPWTGPGMEVANMYEAFHSCGIIMVNEGSVFLNVTIEEFDPLFNGNSYDAATHFLYNVTMNDQNYTTEYGDKGNCSVGYDMGLPGVNGWGDWRPMPRGNTEVAVCYLNFEDTPPCEMLAMGGWNFFGEDRCYRADHAMLEINITVPLDESYGIKYGTLRLIATGEEGQPEA